MSLVSKKVEMGILTVIILIGLVALATELSQFEEVAKLVVIPSLVLLIIVSGYAMWKSQMNR